MTSISNNDNNNNNEGSTRKFAPPASAYSASEGQWTTGLCGCFDDPCNCLITCLCPCITFGQNAEIVDRGLTSCVYASLAFYFLFPSCAFIYTCTYRTKLRSQYTIPEHLCIDCCVHFWCIYCALCQEYRELKNRGLDPAAGWAVNAEIMKKNGKIAPPEVIDGMTR